LTRCVESVLHQTLSDWELLLIDDCSTDETCALIERLARGDVRIRSLRNRQNQGPGPTRNAGLDAAAGKYLLYVDNDDTLERNCLEILLAAAEQNCADVICYGTNYVDTDGRISRVTNGAAEFSGGWEAVDRLTSEEGGIMTPTIWDAFILRDLVVRNNLRFTPTAFEDIFFKYRLVYHARRIVCIKDILYNHYLSRESLSMAYNFKHNPKYSNVEVLFAMPDYVRQWLGRVKKHNAVDPKRERFTYRYFMYFALIWSKMAAQKLGADFLPLFENYARETFGDRYRYFTTLYDLYRRLEVKLENSETSDGNRAELLELYESAVPELRDFRRRREMADKILRLSEGGWDNFPFSDLYDEFWRMATKKNSLPALADKLVAIKRQLYDRLGADAASLTNQKIALALMLYDDFKSVLGIMEPELWPEKLREDFIARIQAQRIF